MIATQSWHVHSLLACGFTQSEILDGSEIHPAIYLLQRAGYSADGQRYHFEWERFGPWSPGLAGDHCEIPELDLADMQVALPEELLVVAERINLLLNPPARSLLNRHAWLNLVASVEFLITQSKCFPDNHADRAPWIANRFSAEQVEMARLALRNVGLL